MPTAKHIFFFQNQKKRVSVVSAHNVNEIMFSEHSKEESNCPGTFKVKLATISY